MDHFDVRRQWADRSGEYSPAYYAHYGPDETSEAIGRHLSKRLDSEAAILELGFGCGRHLAQLSECGFTSLTGIEVNDDAREVMAETYPDLADAGTFYYEAIEDVIDTFEDGHFDAVYSVETLQHVHPEADWVFEAIARITDDVLVTVENEGKTDGTTEDETDAKEAQGEPETKDERVEADAKTKRDETASEEGKGEPDAATARAVTYVNDEFPLYHRNWNSIFTELGFVEVASQSFDTDTLRVFVVD